ncbi:hypothetical protein ACHAXR_009242 [Thalassiosira sp. AJA248-18]
MNKLLLVSISCATIVALILTPKLRTNYIPLRQISSSKNPSSSLQQQRRMLKWIREEDGGPWIWQQTMDPRTVDPKFNNYDSPKSTMTPLHVCDRKAPVPYDKDQDMEILQKYGACPLLNQSPEKTTVLVLEGMEKFGRTGNNLIELLHSFQYGKDHDVLVAIEQGSWATHLILHMWMAIEDNTDMDAWVHFVERALCVKIFAHQEELRQYKKTIRMDTRELFMYQPIDHDQNMYVEFQGHLIRTLWRSYNKGVGYNMRHQRVKDMCSVLDTMFGNDKKEVVYSVIHSRSLLGEAGKETGKQLLARISENVGCDPVAALNMEPEYIKAILQPLGMLDKPILFITDHQRPEILEKLQLDPDIGPNIHLIPKEVSWVGKDIPKEASWIGGDMTVAVMANVFIGNPASTFSGFIAKSRVALGYDTNYLFRKKNEYGRWIDVCDERCVFDKWVMYNMS